MARMTGMDARRGEERVPTQVMNDDERWEVERVVRMERAIQSRERKMREAARGGGGEVRYEIRRRRDSTGKHARICDERYKRVMGV